MAGGLTHDELRSLLGAFALDAAEPHEAALVARHLDECAECQGEVDSYREVAALLASEPAEAPNGPWERIAAGTTDRPRGAAGTPPGNGPQRRRVWLATGLAAAAVAVAGLLAGLAWHQEHRLDRVTRQLATMQQQQSLAAAAASAPAAPGARQVQMRDSAGQVLALAVVLPDRSAYLIPAAMKPLPAGRTYQLWGVAGAEKLSLGVLGAHPGIATLRVPASVSLLAITVEDSPGVVASRNAPIAAAPLGGA